MSVVTPQSIQQMIADAAPRYGVPTWLALAIADVESGFDPAAIGNAGEVGVFQVLPGTAAETGVTAPLFGNLGAQIDAGLRYLSTAYQQAGGNPLLAAAYYNAGVHAAPSSAGFISAVYNYVPKVYDAIRRFGGAALGPLDLSTVFAAAQHPTGAAGTLGGGGAANPAAPCGALDLGCALRALLPKQFGERLGVGTVAILLILAGLLGLALAGARKVVDVRGAGAANLALLKEAVT